MHLLGYDRHKWEALRHQARNSAVKPAAGRIVASDISQQAMTAARKSAMTAGVEHLISFSTCDFRGTPIPQGGGVVILNPEYGERLGQVDQLKGTYKAIGDFFKQSCRGYNGYIFTGNPVLAKAVGLRAKRRTPFFNTTIECRLLEYELYEGSRREKKPLIADAND
jgi:putative N6-adenine-specific DNA methylase